MARIPAQRLTQIWREIADVARTVNRWGASAWVQGMLDQPLKEMLRMRSAQLMGCQY